MMFSKVCMYGAGAIGGWIGARVGQLPGVQLSVVARGDTLRALQQHGLRLRSGDATHTAPTPATRAVMAVMSTEEGSG